MMMMMVPNILYASVLLIITTNIIFVCTSGEVLLQQQQQQQQLQQHNENQPLQSIDYYKNKDYLEKIQIPDIASLQNQKESQTNVALKDMLKIWNTLMPAASGEISKDIPFTIIVPKIDPKTQIDETERLKEFLLEHLIPGEAFITFNDEDIYGNGNRHKVEFKKSDKVNESLWTVNNLKILRTASLTDKLSLIFIDGILGDRKSVFSKRNIQETNRYNEPQRLEMKNATKDEIVQQQQSRKDFRLNPLVTFLAGMKSGTKVFQHFLTKCNLTQMLTDDSLYTVLIPLDNAFQRWHPIDWGFYPFSVQEFTERILKNHFLKLRNPLTLNDVKQMDRGQKYKTCGDEVVLFKNTPMPSVNNVSILSDYSLPNGYEVLIISEVLFVTEAVVSKLHQMHKDKETPPLLAFPWFGAQFLSHSFLALERDNRFSHITRFLNTAEIAHYVSGANYTFFVPIDDAFEKLGMDILPDMTLASENGIKMLLCHFVKRRLYDRDLQNDEVFETIGGHPIRVKRPHLENATINNANIIETEVFVYNLGTMFYIDKILYPDILLNAIKSGDGGSNVESMDMNNNNKRVTKANSNKAHDITDVTESDINLNSNKDINNNNKTFTSNNNNNNNKNINYDDDHSKDDEEITPRALPMKTAP